MPCGASSVLCVYRTLYDNLTPPTGNGVIVPVTCTLSINNNGGV